MKLVSAGAGLGLVAVAVWLLAGEVVFPSQAGPREGQPGPAGRVIEEVARFPAPEAVQGVAVDADHFYAVGNAVIAKYRRETGEKVGEWRGGDGDVVHLNSCVVVEARLACAHSNYPGLPMESSVEWWDVATLEHVESQPVELFDGSLTWALPGPRTGTGEDDGADGSREWWLGFAHYDTRGGYPDRGTEASAVVALDGEWRLRRSFAYPPRLVERLRPYSASGAGWSRDGTLWITGHDEAAVYVLEVPAGEPEESGGPEDSGESDGRAELRWTETIPAPMHGQAWVFDPTDPDVVWGIIRAANEVVVGRVVEAP